MRRATKFGIGVVVSLIVVAYAGFTIWESQWYLAMIPETIETSGAIRISGETHFREGCGVAIFKLSERTAASISRQKLEFLGRARQERGNKSGHADYEPWRETPILERSESNALVLGMSCASLSRSLEQQIAEAAEQPSSFFTTTRGERTLLVSPASRLVVLAYRE